jgi:VanZ family protein
MNDMHGSQRGLLPRIRSIIRISSKTLLITGTIALLFGITIEALQEWMGLGRTAELKDIFYDLAGIFLGFIMVLILKRTRPLG